MKYSLTLLAILGAVTAIPSRGRTQTTEHMTTRDVECAPIVHIDSINDPTDNTLKGFNSFPFYSALAKQSTTPAGWTRVITDSDATIASAAYITMKDLYAYDPFSCANECDNTVGCESFNLFYQREPTVVPGPACPNPSAQTIVRCGLFSAAVTAEEAMEKGQLRGPADVSGQAFVVAIRGSNAYNRAPIPAEPAPGAPITLTTTATETVTATVSECTSTSTIELPVIKHPYPHIATRAVADEASTTASTTRPAWHTFTFPAIHLTYPLYPLLNGVRTFTIPEHKSTVRDEPTATATSSV